MVRVHTLNRETFLIVINGIHLEEHYNSIVDGAGLPLTINSPHIYFFLISSFPSSLDQHAVRYSMKTSIAVSASSVPSLFSPKSSHIFISLALIISDSFCGAKGDQLGVLYISAQSCVVVASHLSAV